MSEVLRDHLRRHISLHGPMGVGTWMGIVLGHPEHGYYMRQNPLGRGGDFTTAPEISQMFGELLGAWAADIWMQMGQPSSFIFLECGPGRGTLMADALRATAGVAGFHEAAQIHLLETSPALRERQAQALAGFDPVWHDGLSSLPEGLPVIALANEFLDALPVRQFIRTKEGWAERVVGLEGESFVFGQKDCVPPSGIVKAEEGDVVEFSSARENFVSYLSSFIGDAGGAALFVDYGHEKSAPGDTLQAVRAHEFCPVLEHVGEADLTAHVDFEACGLRAMEAGAACFGPVEQGAFLNALGLGLRAQALMEKASQAQKDDIEAAVQRLTHPEQMGRLFKVLALASADIQPAGF